MNPKQMLEAEEWTIKLTKQDYNDFIRFKALWDQYKGAYDSEFETARAAIMARELWDKTVFRYLVAQDIQRLIRPESFESADECFETLVKIDEFLRSPKFLNQSQNGL